MNLGTHQEAFMQDLAKLIYFAHSKGYGIRGGELYRTPEQQQIYVESGRSKTMNSRHLKKCAIDLHFTKDGQLCYPEEIGKFWESLNPLNSAGMFWTSLKDSPHFERRVA